MYECGDDLTTTNICSLEFSRNIRSLPACLPCESFPLCGPELNPEPVWDDFNYICSCFLQGHGLKIEDILKDDEVLTAYLLRDAALSESVVYQLVNAKIRLEQVLELLFNHLRSFNGKVVKTYFCRHCSDTADDSLKPSPSTFISTSLPSVSRTCSWKT